jgi:hypothetical protein
MAFTLGSLLLAALFFINAVAVLNEQRFLAKSTAAGGEGGGRRWVKQPAPHWRGAAVGWGRGQASAAASYEPANPNSYKAQAITFISSVHTLMRRMCTPARPPRLAHARHGRHHRGQCRSLPSTCWSWCTCCCLGEGVGVGNGGGIRACSSVQTLIDKAALRSAVAPRHQRPRSPPAAAAGF